MAAGFLANLWNHVARDWRVILQAKTVFGSAALPLVVGTAVIVWRGTAALDSAEIAGLNATIKADEATIKFQDVRLTATLPTIPAPQSPPSADVDFSDLRPLSNASLRIEAYALTKSLRELETTYKDASDAISLTPRQNFQDKQKMQDEWNDMIRKQDELQRRENYEWQTSYRGRVLAIYNELCRRLGILPVSESSLDLSSRSIMDREAVMVLTTGAIAGYYPISALADYLESLARQLH